MRRATIITLILVALPSIALANPSPMGGRYGIGLFAEALLIAVILGSKGFNPIRFFYSWGAVTVATFMNAGRRVSAVRARSFTGDVRQLRFFPTCSSRGGDCVD